MASVTGKMKSRKEDAAAEEPEILVQLPCLEIEQLGPEGHYRGVSMEDLMDGISHLSKAIPLKQIFSGVNAALEGMMKDGDRIKISFKGNLALDAKVPIIVSGKAEASFQVDVERTIKK